MDKKQALDELRVLTLHSVMRVMGIQHGTFLGGLNVSKSSDAMYADYSKGVNHAAGFTVGDRYVRITIEVV